MDDPIPESRHLFYLLYKFLRNYFYLWEGYDGSASLSLTSQRESAEARWTEILVTPWIAQAKLYFIAFIWMEFFLSRKKSLLETGIDFISSICFSILSRYSMIRSFLTNSFRPIRYHSWFLKKAFVCTHRDRVLIQKIYSLPCSQNQPFRVHLWQR